MPPASSAFVGCSIVAVSKAYGAGVELASPRSRYLGASNVNVRVSQGEVTLSGTVDDRRQKRMAEDAIESVSGIQDIYNQLRVKGQQSTQQGQGAKANNR